jgi:hypothetical protein
MKRIIIGIYVDETIERLQQTLVALRANTPKTHETLLLLDGAEAVTREAAVTVQGVELSATPVNQPPPPAPADPHDKRTAP